MAPPPPNTRQNDTPQRPVLLLLVAIGLVVGGRSVQLALRDLASVDATKQTSAESTQSATTAIASNPPVAASRCSPSPLDQDPELRAILTAACPHALELFEQEGLPDPEPKKPLRLAMTPDAHPARNPGLRLAQQSGDWLVPPDNWFVPEDLSKAERGERKAEGTRESHPELTPEPLVEPEDGEPAPADDPRSFSVQPVPTPTVIEPPLQEPPKTEPAPAEEPEPQGLSTEPPEALPAPPTKIAPKTVQPPTAEEPSPVETVPAFGPPSLQMPAPSAEPTRRLTLPAHPRQPAHPHQAAPVASPHSATANAADKKDSEKKLSSIEAHRELFAKNCYPSARECGECHKKVYDEWRISSHAYAFVSPMFQKFEQKITNLSQGTVGYFCYRCHSPVGVSMSENRATPIWDMPKVAREGVTCIACHRINERYTKANGERRIVPGDIHSPIYGGIGGDGVAAAIAKKDHYKVKTSPDQKGAGQAIHLEGRYFDQLGQAEFCTSCHQVAVHPGIKLEVVWEQYRQSPACKKGVTCQDCHMGKKPGEASGYEICSIAEVGGKSVNEHRKHANHIFYGPNYSISHPGIFPQSKDGDRWKMHEWLKFDWRAGWGTDDFEDAVDDGKIVVNFPEEWKEADDRYDAREVIEDNLKALDRKREIREEVMSHSLHITGPYFKRQPQRNKALRLYYDVTNMNEGHNVLTASLGAQPQLWANVVLIGPGGQRLWESGYTDSDGDVCDIHSTDVRTGRAPFDSQLFNLQTMFLITGATGTDREMPLPVNVDIDQLPFLRPGAIPITTTNHPPFIRMESRSIAPLGTKRVHYKIPAKLIQQPGKYRLSFRMRNRIEPIWFMRFCEATDEMVRGMNEGILDVHPRSVEFWVR